MTTEHGTLSAVIDDAVKIAGRGIAAVPQLISFARSSMREAQMRALFHRDMTETTITADASPYIWTLPNNFRVMKTVYYQATTIYPPFITPGRSQKDKDYFFYAGPTYFAFKGVSSGDLIDIAYFSYFQRLPYYTAATRPAKYDLELQKWQYLDASGAYVDTLGDATQDAAAQAKVTNWMLFDWHDLVLEGVLAKQFKTNGDQRSVTHFSMFKSLQTDLLKGEASEAAGH